jgi:hypothetical protein
VSASAALIKANKTGDINWQSICADNLSQADDVAAKMPEKPPEVGLSALNEMTPTTTTRRGRNAFS